MIFIKAGYVKIDSPVTSLHMIEVLGLTVLRNLLKCMKECSGPAWFSIIADKTTDVSQSKQLNLSIHRVSDDYTAHEDPIGLIRVPDTKADTIFEVIKDVLVQCNLYTPGTLPRTSL